MKFRVIVTIYATLLISCAGNNNEVVIWGQVMGELPQKLGHTVPVNGTCFHFFNNEIESDSLRRFEIITQIDKPSFINFLFSDSPSLIVEPGKKYDIILDINPIKGYCNLKGETGKVQAFYNNQMHTNPRSCLFNFSEDLSQYNIIQKKLQSELEREIAQFKEFYNDGYLTEDVLELLKSDRNVYYSVAQATLASINHSQYRRAGKEVPNEIFDLWAEAVLRIPLTNPYLINAVNAWDYLDYYFWYNVYNSFDFDEFVKIRNQKRSQGLIHNHNIELAKKYFDNEILEYYLAIYFIHPINSREFENDLSSNLEQFKIDYPNSLYLPFLEP
jgi:hypothetical protein